ncbi:MAG TPA: nuclear transport factor 2 family protein [bacterium]
MTPPVIEKWFQLVKSHNDAALGAILADDVVFQSPVVHTPQVGKAITTKYLTAAAHTLNNASFRYANTWYGTNSAVLEFETTIDGIVINGVDLIEWNAANQIVKFKVMVRPLKAVNLLHQLMMRALEAAK